MATDLHRARLEVVTETLLASGVRQVADLGCGHGELLQRLRDQAQFERLLGVDIDPQALAIAREQLGLDLLSSDQRLQLCRGSFEDTLWANGTDIDAVVLLETIEHIDPGRLSRVERAVFGQIHPALILVTTPNKEYNPLHGMPSGERRHPGHRFEWTRAQFSAWCIGVAKRQGYSVAFRGIGDPDPGLGSSTQMACFCRQAGNQLDDH